MDTEPTDVGAKPCPDRFAWERACLRNPELGWRQNGKTVVSKPVVTAVAAVLATYADGPHGHCPGGNIRPGVNRLVNETGASQRQVEAALARLVELGYLQRAHRGCRNRAAVYRLALPPMQESLRSVAGNPSENAEDSVRQAADNSALAASDRSDCMRPDAAHHHTTSKSRSRSGSGGPIQSPLTQAVADTCRDIAATSGSVQLTEDDPQQVLENEYPHGWGLLLRLVARFPQALADRVWADDRVGELVAALDDVARAVSSTFALDVLTSDWPTDGVSWPVPFLLHPRRVGKLQQAAAGQRHTSSPAKSSAPTKAPSASGVVAVPEVGGDPGRQGGESQSDLAAFKALPHEQQRPWREAALEQLRREGCPTREGSPMQTARAARMWELDDPTYRPAEDESDNRTGSGEDEHGEEDSEGDDEVASMEANAAVDSVRGQRDAGHPARFGQRGPKAAGVVAEEASFGRVAS